MSYNPNPSDFTGDYHQGCLENTRKQTLQSIYDWVNDIEKPNVFLLTGGAGTGKSTIATTVSREYRRRGQLGCRMFFGRGGSNSENILKTIVYSLAMHDQSIAKAIIEQTNQSGDLNPANLKQKFILLLRGPLSAVAANTSSPILIVLDAPDECYEYYIGGLVRNLIIKFLPTLPSNFRFLVTTRSKDVIPPFMPASPLNVHTLNLDHRWEEGKLDVHMYIKHELEIMRSSNTLIIPQNWKWDKGIQSLANTADGWFLWASSAIKFISEKKAGRSRRSKDLVEKKLDPFYRLKDLVEKKKTVDFNELYASILKNAFKWVEKTKEIFVGVFSFILFGKSQLSDESIDGILGTRTAPDVLINLRPLVVYEPGNPATIRHKSFRDYLVSCKSEPWYIDTDVQKAYIASKCFERMGRLLRRNICNLQSGFVLNADIPDLDNRVTQFIPPSLIYICCHWAHHLQDVPYSKELCSQLRSFAYNHLLFWFEVLSLTNTFNDHVGPALLLAIDWIGVSALC